jgi:putative SOS response-associated peptidase YedK
MYAQWLDPDTTDKEKVQEMLDAIPEQVLTPRGVTDRVNSVRNNGPEFIEPAP